MYPRLDSSDTYQRSLSLLIKKWSARGRLDRMEASGVTLADLRSRTSEFAQVLANSVRKREFLFSALTPTQANIDGKLRQLYRPNLVDAVVLAATAKYLAAVAEPNFSPALHSFRNGRSATAVVRLVSQYFTQYRAAVPVRERGLHVLQRDIAAYGESIDNSPNSALFEYVERALQNDSDPAHRELARGLVRAAILQPVLGHGGAEKTLECGVPTGSPIQPVCSNLYLSELDTHLDSVSGAFYARFGDDVLFVHPSFDVCQEAALHIEHLLTTLKLRTKPEKRRNLYVNGAGRPSAITEQYKPTTRIEYLGYRIEFSGELGLKQGRERNIRTQLLKRFRNIHTTAGSNDPQVLAKLMCDAVAKAFDLSSPLALAAAERLQRGIDNRNQLKDLDYRVALMIAEAASGRRGPRAFRSVSFRSLRQMGLVSLVTMRHRGRPVRPKT